MAEQNYLIVKVRQTTGSSPYLTISEVAYRCGVHPDLVDRFLRLGLIDSVELDRDGRVLFDYEVVPLVRKILRIRNQLGVNYAGIGVIFELIARIDALEAYIKDLENRLR
ncbi:MAG: chaperone modulator CbpM [Syntrophobacteraceae bacterium]